MTVTCKQLLSLTSPPFYLRGDSPFGGYPGERRQRADGVCRISDYECDVDVEKQQLECDVSVSWSNTEDSGQSTLATTITRYMEYVVDAPVVGGADKLSDALAETTTSAASSTSDGDDESSGGSGGGSSTAAETGAPTTEGSGEEEDGEEDDDEDSAGRVNGFGGVLAVAAMVFAGALLL